MAENKKDILKMAMIYSQEGKWEKAIKEYKKLLTLDPTDYKTHSMLGDAYMKMGDDQLAYDEYMTAANAYLKQGLVDKANIIYKKIIKLNPDKLKEEDRKKQFIIKKNSEAEKYIEEGNLDKAIATYQEILKISPESFDAYQKLGELNFKKGNKEEALKYYQKVVDVYFKNRLYKKALPLYQKILEITPDDISIREKIAEIYEREDNKADAKREFLQLAEYYWNKKNVDKTDYFAQKAIDFRSIEAHFFKGAALYMKKQYEDAKRELEMLLRFKANHINALLIIANVYKETGDTEKAISTYNKIIKIQPENPEAHKGLAELYLKKGLKKDAISQLLIAANIYIKNQKYNEAEEILEGILSEEPDNIEVLQKLADLHSSQKDNKKVVEVYLRISDIYKNEGMDDKAEEYYKMAEELDPAHPEIVKRAKNKGVELPGIKTEEEIEVKLKKESQIPAETQNIKKEQITDKFGKIEKQQVEPVDSLENTTINLTEKKDIPSLEKDFVVETQPPVLDEDVPSLLVMADSYMKTGAIDEAIEMYQRALEKEPENDEIKKKLTLAYSKYAGVDTNISIGKKPLEAKEEEEEKKKKEEEEKKKKEEEEKKKKEEEEKKKKEEEEKKKKEEEEKKKKEEEEKKKKEEEEKKKKAGTVRVKDEEVVDEEIGVDFVTVTAAEIFMKQGLFTEAEKILKKIIKNDPTNIEAKLKLDEIKKMKPVEDKKKDRKDKKGKKDKISYI